MSENLIDLNEIPESLEERIQFLQGRIAEMNQYYFEDFGNKLSSIVYNIHLNHEKNVYEKYGWIAARYATIPFEQLKSKPYMVPLLECKGLIEELGRKIVELFDSSTKNKEEVKYKIAEICSSINQGGGARYRAIINAYIDELKKIPQFKNVYHI